MKCIELKVVINVPDDYECDYPFDTLTDINWRDDFEVTSVEKLNEYEF